MTQSQVKEHAGTSVSSAEEKKPAGKKPEVAVMLQVLAMIGIAVLVYPSAADWVNTLGHNSEVSGYAREVEKLPAQERVEKIQQALEYNAEIPGGVLRDPYSRRLGDQQDFAEEHYQSYLEQLSVEGKETIGEVSYPRLGISLPIYHGTDDATISKGIGHLYGSSLPVGGSSSHAVMTSHSGLINASLFTKLPDAQVGDVFTVTVLGERNYYKVRNLETVLPHETGSLQVMEGEDWITLLTCTPISVNSHRFLVQAERIPAPPGEGVRTIAGAGAPAGFPWWVLVFIAGSAIAALLIFSPAKKSTPGRHRMDASQRSQSLYIRKAE